MDLIIFKLSQLGYALNCDVAFTNRSPHFLSQEINKNKLFHLKNGDSIFISPKETNLYFNYLINILNKKKIKVNFYIMDEPIVEKEIIELLLPFSNNMFLQNNIYDHPNVHNFPIGIRDCEKIFHNHKGFSHDYLLNQGKKNVEKEYLCLLCFSFSHNDRYECYNKLNDKKYILNINDNQYEKQESIHCGKVPIWINYEYTHKSFYVLSPRGYGEATHRFFEAIYLGSIPIVKKTNTVFDKLYNIFPCLIINEWDEVTEKLLIENKDFCVKKIKDFKQKYPNAFIDVNSIYELLLLT